MSLSINPVRSAKNNNANNNKNNFNIQTTEAIYIDSINGNDQNSGKLLKKAFMTIQCASRHFHDSMTVYVRTGEYYNHNFDIETNLKNKPPIIRITNTKNIEIKNFPGHLPKLFYDGLLGIEIVNSTNVQVSGFEISSRAAKNINETTIFSIKNSKNVKIIENLIDGCDPTRIDQFNGKIPNNNNSDNIFINIDDSSRRIITKNNTFTKSELECET